MIIYVERWSWLGEVSWIGWNKYYYDKNSNPQTPDLRVLPRIMNTEITLASSTSLGSSSTQLFTHSSWVLNKNRLQN